MCNVVVFPDCALERFEIDRMKAKTKQVKRRMSEAVGDTDSGSVSAADLSEGSVDQFLKNKHLWEKYKSS